MKPPNSTSLIANPRSINRISIYALAISVLSDSIDEYCMIQVAWLHKNKTGQHKDNTGQRIRTDSTAHKNKTGQYKDNTKQNKDNTGDNKDRDGQH